MSPLGNKNSSYPNQQPETTQNMNGTGEGLSFARCRLQMLVNLESNILEKSTLELGTMTESALRKVELKKRKASLIEQNTELLGVIEKTLDQVAEVKTEVKNEKREAKRVKLALLEEVDRLKKLCEKELEKRMEAEAEQKRLRAELEIQEKIHHFNLDIAEWQAEEAEKGTIGELILEM